MLAGWINRNQQAVIALQREETKVLRERLGGNRGDSPMVNAVAWHDTATGTRFEYRHTAR